MALWHAADHAGASAVLVTIPHHCTQAGALFDSMYELAARHDVIIGAAGSSLVSNKTVQRVVREGGRFLSLPLSSNDGNSVLTYDFMTMDPQEADVLSQNMRAVLRGADTLRVTTPAGTDLTFGKKGRAPNIFHGLADTPGKIGSSSFEIYIGMEETKTNGHAVIDGSLGYLGVPSSPIHAEYRDGVLVEIEDSESGRKLREYMDGFSDPGIYVAGEFGIGLNKKSRCRGACYIEDESAYGTFHIGMGRNLALGGVHDAKGHFDLVFCKPTIYADGVILMKDGSIQ